MSMTSNTPAIKLASNPYQFEDELKSLFECPICFDYARPPIHQCQNGHLVCNRCSSKIKNCPTCRVPMSNPSIRNLPMDKLAGTFQIPCRHNHNGCKLKSFWFLITDHEETCNFRMYPCPCPDSPCKWVGRLEDVIKHLGDNHKGITTLSGEDIVFLATEINMRGAVDWVMIQSCYDHHFLLVLQRQEYKSGKQKFYAIVQLIGSQKDARKFKYKLELGGPTSGFVERLSWEARTSSFLEGIQSAIDNRQCLIFDSVTARNFITRYKMDKNQVRKLCPGNAQDENLAINVTIERYPHDDYNSDESIMAGDEGQERK